MKLNAIALVLLVPVVAEASDKLRLKIDKLLPRLEWVESKRNDQAIGDKHLAHKAYGRLQIRQPYLDDVNRIAGASVLAKWGKVKLELCDMHDPAKARWAATVYLEYYAKHFERKTGMRATDEVIARIHNGGVMGWRNTKTVAYWKRVQKVRA